MYELAYVRFLELLGKRPQVYFSKYYKCDHCGTEFSVKIGFCPICYKEDVKFKRTWKKIRKN